MNPKLQSNAPENPLKGGINRRTVLGAAWAAPVILAAVSAPAAAATAPAPPPPSTPSKATLNFDTFGLYSLNAPSTAYGLGTDFRIEIRNKPPVSPDLPITVNTVYVTVLFPQSAFTGAFSLTNDTGWSAGPVTTDGANYAVVFTYSGAGAGAWPLTAGGGDDSTPVLYVNLTTKLSPVGGPPQNRVWPGATITGTAYGIDVNSDVTAPIGSSTTLGSINVWI